MIILGDWLEESGWCHLITEAQIASSGTAQSFLKASHVKKTRHAHEVTAATLHILMKQAYDQYAIFTQVPLNFDAWKAKKEKECPQFQFWSATLKLELLLLTFVRSIRLADFSLYKLAIQDLLPWFFALDHIHYARWLSVHLYDMLDLSETNPNVYEHFSRGKFVITKTKKRFSSIGIDHAHEQNNKCVKGDGGMS